MQPASYQKLSEKLYDISFANVLYKPVNLPLPVPFWYNGGDLDQFSLNLNPTRKQRYAKDGRTSYLATEATTRIDSQVTAKFMQKTNFIRAAALLGTPYAVDQEAGTFVLEVTNLVAGQYYSVGAYNLSSPVVKYDAGGGGLVAMAPTFFKLVDPALGVIQVLALPPDAVVDPVTGFCHGSVGGTVTPGDAGLQDTRIDIGTVPQVSLEMIVRGVSDIGQKGYLHLFQVNMAPDGELGFITGNEDFEGLVVKGRAVNTDRGIGYWRSLAA